MMMPRALHRLAVRLTTSALKVLMILDIGFLPIRYR
jgi:hypothetical protein